MSTIIINIYINMSKTYIATTVAIALPLMHAMGLDLNATTLTTTITTIMQIVAWAGVFYGRFKAGGINAFGLRK